MGMKFKVGDKVRFVPENYEWDIENPAASAYKSCVDKVGVVTETDGTLPYPYRAYFVGEEILFTEKELILADFV